MPTRLAPTKNWLTDDQIASIHNAVFAIHSLCAGRPDDHSWTEEEARWLSRHTWDIIYIAHPELEFNLSTLRPKWDALMTLLTNGDEETAWVLTGRVTGWVQERVARATTDGADYRCPLA